MSGKKTPVVGSTLTFGNAETATIIRVHYHDGEAYYDVKYADGSIRNWIPADSTAANAVGYLNEAAGKPSTL
jgi:hypothetical protein